MEVRAQNDLYFENCHAVYKALLVIVTLSNTNQSKAIIFAPVFVFMRHAITIDQLIKRVLKLKDIELVVYSFCDTFCKSHLKKGKSWMSPFL